MSVRSRAPRLIVTSSLAGAALLVALTGCVPAGLFPGGSSNDDAPASSAPEVEAPTETETAAPVATEVKGENIKTETFANGLQLDVFVLGYGESKKGSNFQTEDGKDAYPKGTPEVALAFVLSNPTDAPLSVYGFSQTGAFEGSKYYATTNSDSTNATHILLGYDSAPYDTYGFDLDEWPLEPGDTAYYAASVYLESDTFITNFSLKETGADDYMRIEDVELKLKA